MEPILTIDNLNSFGGNMLRQGDKSQLKYRLRDVGNKNLAISGKSCEIKMYGRDYTTVVYETTATVSTENTVSFTIDKVLPKGTFYLEFTVGDYIFPTDHREFFEITPSGKGTEANIIEIVGKDVLIQEVKTQVDTELQPLVTSLESAQQAEIQRLSNETVRVSAEEQREIDHANRSAELAGKADKKQEDWITPTLLNGATTAGGGFRYRKTTYGTLQFRGVLRNLKVSTHFMILPTGYRVNPYATVGVPANTSKTYPVLIDGLGGNWGTAGGVGVNASIDPSETLYFDGIELPLL